MSRTHPSNDSNDASRATVPPAGGSPATPHQPVPTIEGGAHGDIQPPEDPSHLPLDEDHRDDADLDKFMP